jgi:hypothetical protein
MDKDADPTELMIEDLDSRIIDELGLYLSEEELIWNVNCVVKQDQHIYIKDFIKAVESITMYIHIKMMFALIDMKKCTLLYDAENDDFIFQQVKRKRKPRKKS